MENPQNRPEAEYTDDEILKAEVPPDLLEDMREIVHSDTPEGFMLYYLVAAGRKLPRHAVEWIYKSYLGRWQGKKTAIEAFRGSIKSTVFTRYFTAYQIGLRPHTSNLFVQASNDHAKDNARWVASHVEHSPAWQLFFPYVQRDEKQPWGESGYFVVDRRYEYGEWLAKRHENPTLLGTGYRSQDKLGKHPTGMMIIDDIHDAKNTRSPLLFQEVIDIHDQELVPMPTNECWVIYVFTPWVEGDIGDRMRNSPRAVHCRTPVWKEDDEGVLTDEPTWPEEFPPERIEELEETIPPAVFAQMYLMDLRAAQGAVLKKGWWHWYPASELDDSWPVAIGVDFASVESQQKKHLKGRDHFALSVFSIHPGGKLILIDGFVGHVTQGQAEDKLKDFLFKYDERVQSVGIEKLGKGENFALWALKSLPYSIKPQGVGNKSKGERFEFELGPAFRRGRIWIADYGDKVTTPHMAEAIDFIDQSYDEWVAWDGTERFFDDCLDAMWHGIEAAKWEIFPHTPEEMMRRERDEKLQGQGIQHPMSGMIRT